MLRFAVVTFVLFQSFLFIDKTRGHGMMLNPAGRSSRWRVDPTAIPNYDDMSYNCGGYKVQYEVNGGKCGLCGDDFMNKIPRDNELGGKYGGSGVIVQTYPNGQNVNVHFKLTQNHLGYVRFDLCNLDNFNNKESEECFSANPLILADGIDKFHVGNVTGDFNADVVLPTGLNCEHCVMRWTYHAANNWGQCENDTGELGCSDQETFKSCADIRITN